MNQVAIPRVRLNMKDDTRRQRIFPHPSKRKLGRRDATGFKELPHLDDLLFSQVAMSVPERGGMSMELHANSIAKLIIHLCPDILQEMYDLLEINIRADWMGE
jgi:hypothetical protein